MSAVENHRAHFGNAVRVGQETEIDRVGHQAGDRVELEQFGAVETGDVGLTGTDDRDVLGQSTDLESGESLEARRIDDLNRPGLAVDHVVTAEKVSHEGIHTDPPKIRRDGPGIFYRH